MIKKLFHYLFKCPTFWHYNSWFTCPECGSKYPCYWDGHDCECGTIHLCSKCEVKHRIHLTVQPEGVAHE